MKPQPKGENVLCVESVGTAGGEFGGKQAIDGLSVRYSLQSPGGIALLDDLQWMEGK
jgi:hypothetical protein